MKTLIMGTLLFFLFTGFNSLLPEHIHLHEPIGKEAVVESVVEKKRNGLMAFGSRDTIYSSVTKTVLELNFIPDARVQLATGEHLQLQHLIDQKKYIFINVWSGKKGKSIEEVRAVDSIGEFYKNKLVVVGLFDEGNLTQLKRLIKKHQLKNIQGLISADIKKYLKVKVYPYGVLFSKTGKLIEAGMDKETLAAYMEKHVVMSKAKF
jgi:hypothetical protein